MNQEGRASNAELLSELRRLEAEVRDAATDEAAQSASAQLNEVRWELMTRGQIASGGGCAQ